MSTKATETSATPPVEAAKPPVTPEPPKPAPGEAARNRMLRVLSTGKDEPEPVKVTQAPAEPPKPAEPSSAALASPATPPATPEPPKKKTVKVKEPPALTEEQVKQIAREAATAATKPAEPPKTEPELPPEIAAKAEIYAEMERMNPKKYPPGLVKRVADAQKKELEYKTKWETANPGIEFNPDDSMHDDFYANQEVPDERDEFRAEARVEAKRETETLRKELEDRKRKEQAAPIAEQTALAADVAVLSQFIEGEVSEKTVKDFEKANPIAHETAVKHIMQTRPVLKAVSLIFDGVDEPDPKNATHREVYGALNRFEGNLLKVPRNELTNEEDQQWVPLATFEQLPESERPKYYTTAKADLIQFIARESADKAKKEADQLVASAIAMAERLGYQKPGAAAPTPPATPANGAPAVPPATPAPSPSMGSISPQRVPGTVVNNGDNKPKGIFDRLIHGTA